MTSRGKRGAARGFTLIEMLVVMAILVVLAGVLFPIASSARVKGQAKALKTRIDTIAGAVAQYANDFGDFPPTSLNALGARGNGINEGSEALVRCLTTKSRNGPYFEFQDAELANTDGDKLSSVVDPTASVITSKDLFEAVDPWGHPLVYYHHRDFRGAKGVDRYNFGDRQENCVPQPTGKTGTFPAFGRFLIWSAGPDGKNENGQGDDVCSWK